MATVVSENGVPILDSLVAKRSEALPKTSLFGSALEIQDEKRLQNMRNIDAKANKAAIKKKRDPPKYNLPADVKAKLEGKHVYERSKHDLTTQQDKVNIMREELRQKEQQAFQFQAPVSGSGDEAQHTSNRVASDRWFSEKDLEGSQNINIVGLNKNQSYNRDKYGRKPPTHSYSLIGDLLQPGMDFPVRQRTEIQMRNAGYGKGDLRGILAEEAKSTHIYARNRSARGASSSVVDLPPNIKHTYGSKVCNTLLSDKELVDKTIKNQEEIKESVQRPSQTKTLPKYKKEMKPEYDMLSNALRMNVCAGYTMNHKISTTKTDFNDQAHLFRHTDPDKWRYQRDELSTWAEHNVLRQRMTKAWEQYFSETNTKKQGST